jgi:orotidine-5'-phosphate decarboxylase
MSIMTNALGAHDVFEKLNTKMTQNNSLVCVGLDPDASKIPQSIRQSEKCIEDSIYTFLTQVIDITAPHACSFKLQKAFYDQYDNGHFLLKKTTDYIHTYYPDTPVFIDCKIGDTDNTMQAYMYLLFDKLQADAIVINPYMGDDVLKPFMEDRKKAGIVLIQTSNPDAKIVQELTLCNGEVLWEKMLDLTLKRWNVNDNLMIVLSSNTQAHDYALVRERIPQNTPILLAGIGMQGGDASVMKQLLNNDKKGVFVNSSRGILYPYDPEDTNWKTAVLQAVTQLQDMLNNIRFG